MKAFLIILTVCALLQSTLYAQPRKTSSTPKRPKLVVGIVVDQMRWDYLYRYQDRYGENGFNRLLKQGYSCAQTFISHLPSFTAVGHSTIYTGAVPAVHGIVGNEWMDQITGKKWYCTEDENVQTIGSQSDAGKMSPRHLRTSTLGDELRLATNFRSKVVGVSLKDRAAILPAGHTANGAYWLDDESGCFVSSTYYMKELPEWVKHYNEKKVPEQLVAKGWNTLYPLRSYVQSSADDVKWEGTFKGEDAPVFPHNIAQIYKKDPGVIRYTPFGNSLTLDFAKAAVEGYALGQSEVTDFLAINCASTDYVGHKFGPNSIEVEDTYLRLDQELAGFLSFLDKQIGKGNYLLFLTADHGAAHSVNFMKEHRLPAGFFQTKTFIKELNERFLKEFDVEKLVRSGVNYQLHFDHDKIAAHQLDFTAIKEQAIAYLQKQAGVQFALDIQAVGSAPVPQPVREMIVNGNFPKRTGSIMMIPEPGWFQGFTRGTTHGTWNPYDTHIPLLFMGWGIPHGESHQRVHMTDIAPTLAALLHIQMPNGTTGKVIREVLDH
ncbi:alkaline phosphatase PafA [Rapidithrix thailandica]|uniref:Alkaline phosphatase PafA n=1 Tax=Rapidithrix thailandica TaxID=413964 RepID=A0AAW9S3J0_9BACT